MSEVRSCSWKPSCSRTDKTGCSCRRDVACTLYCLYELSLLFVFSCPGIDKLLQDYTRHFILISAVEEPWAPSSLSLSSEGPWDSLYLDCRKKLERSITELQNLLFAYRSIYASISHKWPRKRRCPWLDRMDARGTASTNDRGIINVNSNL